MSDEKRKIRILLADDDEDDRFLAIEALEESQLTDEIETVVDGVDLLDYLHKRGKYEGLNKTLPDLILLDLNMPKMDGREALKEIKADPQLRRIPIVVLTTSKAEEDIYRTYDLGVNSFISKPVSFERMVETMKILSNYWFHTVTLPPENKD